MLAWRRAGIALLALAPALLYPACASAELSEEDAPADRESFFREMFIDPEDGKFDVSAFLASRAGLMPVPILITEPAVGYGGGVVLGYFHGSIGGEAAGADPAGATPEKKGGTFFPPVSMVGGMATENGTWAAFGGHVHSWDEDRNRYMGGAGYADVNLDFFGIAGESTPTEVSLSYNIKTFFLLQEYERRIGDSDFFLGGRYVFSSQDVTFDAGESAPGLDPMTFDANVGGAGPILIYDTRNNFLNPSAGSYVVIRPSLWDDWLGSDFRFEKLDAAGHFYWPLHPSWIIALRLDGQFSDGDTPFYMLPFISLRGVPAMRYLGKHAVMGEAEVRWTFYPRWTLVGFLGAGRAAASLSELDDADTIHTRGGGIRYLIARAFGLQAGVDVAWGPEDTAFYLRIGGGWH